MSSALDVWPGEELWMAVEMVRPGDPGVCQVLCTQPEGAGNNINRPGTVLLVGQPFIAPTQMSTAGTGLDPSCPWWPGGFPRSP